MSQIQFHIDPKERSLLERAGWASFSSLMQDDLGDVVTLENDAQTRRLKFETEQGVKFYFLKRTLAHNRKKNLPSLLQFVRPQTNTFREKEIVEQLAALGIPVMRVVAWGEESNWGLPLRGFILVEGVQGTLLHDAFLAGDKSERVRISSALGDLLGRLHALGFYQVVRLKDLISPNFPGSENEPLQVVLIDRAANHSRRKFFWSRFCLGSLQRGFHRMKRAEAKLNADEQNAFAKAYCSAVSPRWKISSEKLKKQLGW